MDKLGGRRFLLVIGCALIYTTLLVAGYLGGGEYVTLQSLTIGAYIAANGVQKYHESKAS